MLMPTPVPDHRLDDLDVLGLHHDLRFDPRRHEELVDGAAGVRAGLEQHERLPDQVLRQHLALARQRVLGGGDEQQFLLEHRER